MTPRGRERCFSYLELKSIAAGENHEPLVNLRTDYQEILCGPGPERMVPYVGNGIYVRKGVAERLVKAQKSLTEKFPDYRLKVIYGYRHPEVQESGFRRVRGVFREERPELSEDELLELVHHYVAIPEVAGHPTGGSIDITIESSTGELDMGCKMGDFSEIELVHTYSDKITPEQLENRLLLRSTLEGAGFAPYDFEWWHFSYGEREWGCYYGKSHTEYDVLMFRI